MNSKKLHKLIWCVIILITFSCEEQLNIDGKHQAILNVHFMKDSAQAYWMQLEPVDKDAIIATLHQSLDITDTVSANRKLENARIEIYSDGELVTCIEPENELYTSTPWTPVEGKTYQVYAYADGYPVLTGECQTPYTVPINYIEYKYTHINDEYNSFIEFEGFINITDPIDQNNYYYLNVIHQDSYGESLIKLQYLDPFIEEGYILSDEFFNGENHNIHFKPHPYYFISEGNIIFELWSISESYYNIYKSMYKYHYINHDYMYAEPVQIYSNVNNGLGVISASTVFRDTIRIPNKL